MKRQIVLLTFFCALSLRNAAQTYGTVWTNYPSSYSTSCGFATSYMPGVLWFGSESILSPGGANFYIGGYGISTPWPSWGGGLLPKFYIWTGNSNCTGSLSQATSCSGISAIETGDVNKRFAIAGVIPQGVFFNTLNSTYGSNGYMLYPFPYQPSGAFPAPSQPLIIESIVQNEFYICGSFEDYIYVLNIDNNGSVLWSNFYKMTNELNPKDLILNPYTPGNIIIVGKANISPTDNDGFFMELKGANGTVLTSKTFGLPGISESFNTILASASTGAGFTIGGYTQQNGNLLLVKLDPLGSFLWGRVITPNSGQNSGFTDLIERQNTLSNYEYYGLTSSASGMVVAKLDNNGLPFPLAAPNALFNEFVYDLPGINPSVGTSLSYVNAPMGSPLLGIQVYGTAYNNPGFSSGYVAAAYFNGESNCLYTPKTLVGTQQIQFNGINQLVSQFGSLNSCSNIIINAGLYISTLNTSCSGVMLSGSNQRVTTSSGSTNYFDQTATMDVYPNPTSDIIKVKYNVTHSERAEIFLENLLGEKVLTIPVNQQIEGDHVETINLQSLNIESGIYFLKMKTNNTINSYKLVYDK